MIKFPLVNDEIDIRIMDPVKKEYKISYKESQINNNLQSYYQKESEDYINKYKLFEEQIVNSKDENHKYELMVSEDSLAVSFVKQLTHKYLTISDKSGLSIIINDLTGLIGTRNHPDEIRKLFELLSVKEQEGFYGSGIKTYLEQTNKIAFGQKINFDFIDINSKLHSINEFEGKFVLLEFWASWCGPCLSQIPFLKEIAKNSDKIQLISISIDDDLNNWRSKVESLKMDWINIHCKQSNIDLKNEFFITTVPFNILISNEGKIVGKDIPINDLMKLLN